MLATILQELSQSEEELLFLQQRLVAIPALGPTNNGEGEAAKIAFLAEYLGQFQDLSVEQINAPDPRVPCGCRPSLVIRRSGNSNQTLWLIAHTDIVPTGDLNLWASDPYALRRDGDLIFGRGVEDNHQGLVSALLLLRALDRTQARHELSLGIVLAADEETGNALGIEYIMREHGHLFAPEDLVIIPDFGTPEGDAIEIAEKSVLWLKFVVRGQQCHASTPAQGNNSLVACSALILALDELHTHFGSTDDVFDPPGSTFVPTKKEANVPNVNTIPGQDIFYLDCRVLPGYDLDAVEQHIRSICDTVATSRNVSIEFERVVREQAAPGTPADCLAARLLSRSIAELRGISAKTIGIGGGTVAASFRKRGRAAVCWSTLNNTAHQPNESSSISNTIADAKVFAHLLCADLML